MPGGRHASVTGGCSRSRHSSPWPSSWPSSPASSTTPARLPHRLQLPTPSPTPTQADSPLSSPALAPGEQTRGAIPWSEVGVGWAVIATASPPTAVTMTLLLVSPTGARYAIGSAPDGIVVQDVSADGRHILVALGARAEDWDVQAGTAHPVTTPYGWKSIRYSGPDPSYGYLVLWIDSSSSVRLARWTADGDLRTEYDTALASTAGSPRHPGVLVSADGSTALLSSRDGPLLLLDLATDAVAGPGPFTQPPSCEPLGRWTRTEAVVGCGSSVQVNTYDSLVGLPLLVTPVGASPTRAAVVWATTGFPVVQLDNLCSGSVATLSGRRSRHADQPAKGRDRSGPQRRRRRHAVPRWHPLRFGRRPAGRLRPRLQPGHRPGRPRRRRPDGPSGLRPHHPAVSATMAP